GGIPALIGGAVFMNAGAHGSEISAVLRDVVLARGEGIEQISTASLPFRYRHSGIPSDSVVVSATFTFTRGDREKIAARRAELLKERKARQPLTQPSAGSVFKNPSPERTAGQILEECGLKGFAAGGVQISPLHANWIVNPNRLGTAQDVLVLIGR